MTKDLKNQDSPAGESDTSAELGLLKPEKDTAGLALFLDLNRWFFKTSRQFCGVKYGKLFFPFCSADIYGLKYSKRDFFYFPIAWLKFMWMYKNEIFVRQK